MFFPNKIRFLIPFFLFIQVVSADPRSPINLTKEIKQVVDHASKADSLFLETLLNFELNKMNSDERTLLFKKTTKKIKEDLASLEKYLSKKKTIRVSHIAYLKEIVAMSENTLVEIPTSLSTEYNELKIKYFETSFKIFWIYALMIHKEYGKVDFKNELLNHLNLVYTYPIKCSVDIINATSPFISHNLSEKSCAIHLPNSGFVFGGNFVTQNEQSVCKGIDCSSLVSKVYGCSRLSTMVMDYGYLELKYGSAIFSPEEFEIRKEFLEKWHMDEVVEKFDPIDVYCDDTTLMPGDLIVWRNRTKLKGHVSILLSHNPESGTIEVIEANKFNGDKLYEGIVQRSTHLIRDGMVTFALRLKDLKPKKEAFQPEHE